MNRRPNVLVMRASVAMVAVMIATVAAAQDPLPTLEEETESSRLAVDLKVGVWIPRLDGDVGLGANSGSPNIALDEQFDLNESEIAINAELTLRFDDRWYLRASGFDFSTDTTNTFVGNETFGSLTLNDGDPFTASVDMTSIALEFGKDFSRPVPDRRRSGNSNTSLRFSWIAGVRFLRVDQDVVRVAGGSANGSGNWLALYTGLDLQLRWPADPERPDGRGLVLDGGVGVGVDPVEGGVLFHVRAGLILEFTDNIGFHLGYRLLEVDFEDAPYGFDAGLQGLFVGGTFRF